MLKGLGGICYPRKFKYKGHVRLQENFEKCANLVHLGVYFNRFKENFLSDLFIKNKVLMDVSGHFPHE